MTEILTEVQRLVKELRNSRDVEPNWADFEELVREHQEGIVRDFSMR